MNEVRRQQGADVAADEPLTSREPNETAGSAATGPTEDEQRAETENWIREQLAGKAAVTERSGTATGDTDAEATATADEAARGEDTVPVTDSTDGGAGDTETAGTETAGTETAGTETVSAETDNAETDSAETGKAEPDNVESDSSETDGGADDADADADKVEALPAYQRFDITGSDPAVLAEAAEAARTAIENGECIVLPTDTVYGIGADAFEADAVQRLLDTKERGRDMPPPVLIGDPALIRALAEDVPESAGQLTEKHWPGPLTVIVKARESLRIDLGETNGTIGLRVPDYELTRELLRQTGPMAVSSANLSGRSAALTCDEAIEYFGNRVSVYLDGGPVRNADGAPSSMVDFSQNDHGELLRLGALSVEVLRETCPDLVDLTAAPEEAAADETEGAGAEPDGLNLGEDPAAAAETDVPETSDDVERLIEDEVAPEPTEPEPTGPVPTDPEPTDPEPADPVPTDPEPVNPVDPKPADPDRQP
ncbi:L-threonylcarbamoyladenylate synthase [Microlunatus speluncae]|uniref:L-threonylcarbamoyladenylate synthase n=1 Tax=Microlunatus speluncae TaxID=2594267 RepID=UPI001C2CF5C3|nr:L-threonylcarbamoyladenylate synthase [Microlunatus speluncae]